MGQSVGGDVIFNEDEDEDDVGDAVRLAPTDRRLTRRGHKCHAQYMVTLIQAPKGRLFNETRTAGARDSVAIVDRDTKAKDHSTSK